MILGATLYLRDSIEAAQFYCNAFNMHIGYNAMYDNGTYLHAELEKDGNSIFAVSESNDEVMRNAIFSAHQPITSLQDNPLGIPQKSAKPGRCSG